MCYQVSDYFTYCDYEELVVDWNIFLHHSDSKLYNKGLLTGINAKERQSSTIYW